MTINPFAAIPVHPANLEEESKGLSPKVTAATLGGAISTIICTILAGYVPHLRDHLGEGGIAAITGAMGTVFAFILGYFFPDPVRTATNVS